VRSFPPLVAVVANERGTIGVHFDSVAHRRKTLDEVSLFTHNSRELTPGAFCVVAYYAVAPAGFDIAIGSVTYISSCAKPSFCFARATARQCFRTACSCLLSTNP
jgi:hypothetical protein